MTPITISGDAPTALSVYMCEMFAEVALVLCEQMLCECYIFVLCSE